MIFDSHCHLLLIEEEGKDLSLVIENAIKTNISHLLDVSVGLSNFFKRLSRIKDIRNRYSISIYMSAGLPPYFADKRVNNDITELYKQAVSDKMIVAVGEIGLDYHYNYGTPNLQKELLLEQIELANRLHLPIIIHTRDSDNDLLSILKSQSPINGGIIHCFSSNYETAKSLLDMGFYISFSGNVTYKKSYDIQEAATKIPDDRILIETDAPYLAPLKHRGKINEPAYLIETATYIAKLRKTSIGDIVKLTEKNAKNILNIA